MLIELFEKYRRFISHWDIQKYDRDGPNLRLTAQIELRDGSILCTRQIVLGETVLKYAYHWQSKSGGLICRWDNSPYWPEIAGYPHHKHFAQKDVVMVTESLGGDLESVFSEIVSALDA